MASASILCKGFLRPQFFPIGCPPVQEAQNFQKLCSYVRETPLDGTSLTSLNSKKCVSRKRARCFTTKCGFSSSNLPQTGVSQTIDNDITKYKSQRQKFASDDGPGLQQSFSRYCSSIKISDGDKKQPGSCDACQFHTNSRASGFLLEPFSDVFTSSPLDHAPVEQVEHSTHAQRRILFEFLGSGQPDGTEEINAKQNLLFLSSSASRPSGGKLNPFGEDAHFISNCGRAVGVADGVGAWRQVNIDSGKYSRELMANAKDYFEGHDDCLDPRHCMQIAYQLSTNKGTCTACIVTINENLVRCANFGDAGFMILRPVLSRCEKGGILDWTLLYKSMEMQHYFNCPVQMGTGTTDTPKTFADTISMFVRPGDLIITATDGLFDNLFNADMKSIVARQTDLTGAISIFNQDISSMKRKDVLREWIDRVTESIADSAVATAHSPVRRTPFSTQAKRAGLVYKGGKLDDVTIVVSLVCNDFVLNE